MEQLKETSWFTRGSKKDNYDKRQIKAILEEVYAGVPRKELIRHYELGQDTIARWLRDY